MYKLKHAKVLLDCSVESCCFLQYERHPKATAKHTERGQGMEYPRSLKYVRSVSVHGPADNLIRISVIVSIISVSENILVGYYSIGRQM